MEFIPDNSFVVTQDGRLASDDLSVTCSQWSAGGGRPLRPQRTLEEAYETLVLPTKPVTSRKQISTHRTSIKQFREFLATKNDRCSEPIAILNASTGILREFGLWLIRTRKLSATTTGHRLTHLTMICRAMRRADWITRVPAAPQSDELNAIPRAVSRPVRRVARSVSFEDVARLMDAASVATYPRLGSVSPGEFWRKMIAWHALYGPRTQDIYAYLEKSKTGLIWSDVFTDPECPDAEVLQELPGLRSEHGWIYYPVGKDRKSNCPFVLFPMPRWMAEFVACMRGVQDPCGQNRVFPVRRNGKRFSATWSAIRKAAGVSESIFLSQGTGGATAFRKTAAKWWKRVTGSDELAQYVLHHAEVTTSSRHYLDTMETCLPLILKHLGEFPLAV